MLFCWWQTDRKMRRLETALQRYAWGKSGSDSMVAQLKKVRFEERKRIFKDRRSFERVNHKYG